MKSPHPFTATLIVLAACGTTPPAPSPPDSPATVASVQAEPAAPQPAPPVGSEPDASNTIECSLPKAQGPAPDCAAGGGAQPFGASEHHDILAKADRDIQRLRAGFSSPPRATTLLDTERNNLEQLLKATPKSAPDRPMIALRICGAISERAAAEQNGSADPNAAETKLLQLAEPCYQKLIAEHPTLASIDTAHVMLAFTLERLGRLSDTRKAYFELIQKFPQSKHVPRAYFAFGELFHRDAASDPSKLQLAEQSFKEVEKYPPPANPLHGAALFRLAMVHNAMGEHERGLAVAMKYLQSTRTSTARMETIESAAVEVLAEAYAKAGRVDRVCLFVQRFARDSDAQLFALRRIAAAYARGGDESSAVTLYRTLERHDHGSAYCEYVAALRVLGH